MCFTCSHISKNSRYPVLNGKKMILKKDIDFSKLPPNFPIYMTIKYLTTSHNSGKTVYRAKDIGSTQETFYKNLFNINPDFLFKYYAAEEPDLVISIHRDLKDKSRCAIAFNRYCLESAIPNPVFIAIVETDDVDNNDPSYLIECLKTTRMNTHSIKVWVDSFDTLNHYICFSDMECVYFYYGYMSSLVRNLPFNFDNQSKAILPYSFQMFLLDAIQFTFDIHSAIALPKSELQKILDEFNNTKFSRFLVSTSNPDFNKLIAEMRLDHHYPTSTVYSFSFSPLFDPNNLKEIYDSRCLIYLIYSMENSDFYLFSIQVGKIDYDPALLMNSNPLNPFELDIFLSKKF